MSVEIREATNLDSADIVRVVRAVYDEYGFTWDADDYHADLYDPEQFYIRDGGAFFVAGDGAVEGVIGLGVHPLISGPFGVPVEHDGRTRVGGTDCSLDRLYVLPESRRKGLGDTLSRAVVERARRQGRTAMEIWSDKKFVDAHRLYRRIGGEQVGERICHDPDQSPEWGLVVRL